VKKSVKNRAAMAPWLFMGALLLLCGVLGALQYRWIGEASEAARERMRAGLHANLFRLSRDFNSEIGAAWREVMPSEPPETAAEAERVLAGRYAAAKANGRGTLLFRRIALAEPGGGHLVLRSLDPERGVFENSEWPENWAGIEQRIEFRFNGPGGPGAPGTRLGGAGDERLIATPIFDLPLFGPGGPGRGPFGRHEIAWAIFEVNLAYVREVLLPELLQRHLEAGRGLEYQVAVIARGDPPAVIYESDRGAAKIAESPDAEVALFDVQGDAMFRRGRGPGPGRGAGGVPPDTGRWEMVVRHRAGSLEAVVAQARWRSLSVTAGVLLLLVVTIGALVRFTRSAQRLADLQMNFVAGVSHELKTPLTAIHTAAYNLRGKLAQNPAQVERYGELIQKESGRLKELVEQVLQFASANAGRVIHEREPVSVERMIEDTVEMSRPVIQAAHCTLEKTVDAGLPEVMADPLALKSALQNLVANAVKYGAKDESWVGISASQTDGAVEIRVADRGPGIPEEEQKHIFDPFFRGKRALQDQVHGTGLGLNLVKRVVEAHGGTIRVQSEEGRGAEFIVRIPALPREATA
jgi:signal transduction histidine kinase